MTTYNVAVSIFHTANVHVGKDDAEERKEFSGLSVKVIKGHTVVSRAESNNNEIKTLYKPPVKKLLRNEKSAASIFGVEIALCNLK